jgi:hypothetical protein
VSKRRQRERPERHVAAVHDARRRLAAARAKLAEATTPDGPPTFVDPIYRWAERLLQQRLPSLLRYPHVLGAGLGTRVVNGIDTGEICVTVLVGRKLGDDSLKRRGDRRLPKELRAGRRRLPLDVVQGGGLKRTAFAGQSCSVTQGVTRSGTIGAPAVDTGNGAAVFLTAMHVTGLRELLPSSGVTLPVNVPSISEAGGAPVIGRVVHGTRVGIDAAKIVLNPPHSVIREIPRIGAIRGWRPMVFPGDKDIPVMMFGAASRQLHTGAIVSPVLFVPGWDLEIAITVRGFDTIEGDSGGALVDVNRFVLGFLVGTASDGVRVFTPAGLVLQRLGCDIPTGRI